MSDPDFALKILQEIYEEFREFCKKHGNVSEADTRVKIIDRILTEVLLWPESQIKREERTQQGFMDYRLSVHGRPYVVVEAKKEGLPFVFPVPVNRKYLSLSGTLLTGENVGEAVKQVRGYCDDQGIRYAVATNGYSWVVFRAIREDIPWRSGMAKIFSGMEDIIADFTEFWNTLSYDAIYRGSLDAHFGVSRRTKRELHRVTDRLFNADLPLQRNRLNAQLHHLIRKIFEDIADQDQVEILQSCYVHSASLKIIAKDLDLVITDSIPSLLKDEGTIPIFQNKSDAGRFGESVAIAINSQDSQLFLLLGGIGSGKTTFLKRYQRTVGKDLLEQNVVWFHVDFLQAPLDPFQMEEFVWRSVLEQLRGRYSTPHLETHRDIKRAFRDEIEALKETALVYLQEGTEEFEKILSPFLQKWQENLREYVPRLLTICRQKRKKGVLFFIDNVDQLPPDYQAQIFLLAQRITRIVNAITIVALREESYYAASIQRSFTAYTNRKFHIASPRFGVLLGSRIKFALGYLEGLPGIVEIMDSKGISIDKAAVADFLKIVQNSIFEKNKNIARFIEAICYGNMRRALQMFTTFLVSGATDVDKMLTIHRRDGNYYVAFHEFVKSIMLEDRYYYKEAHSQIMNVFNCSNQNNSSHFTSLRVLNFLLNCRGDSSKEGRGFVEIARLVETFEDVFDNREDLLIAMNSLVSRQLLEINTRATENITNASHIRITSAGWYYLRYLVNSFAYLDLILQDTPFSDKAICDEIKDMVAKVDNLVDREEEKWERTSTRFRRVELFLDYLLKEEKEEFSRFDLGSIEGELGEIFVSKIRERYDKQREWITHRLKENKEKYSEEQLFWGFDAEEKEMIAAAEEGGEVDKDF
ncbi:MAG: hypothetical protein NT178_02620 [Proteobacteria bacterium]|nr:hypothetical protein [Pseudomonadota bacterium]